MATAAQEGDSLGTKVCWICLPLTLEHSSSASAEQEKVRRARNFAFGNVSTVRSKDHLNKNLGESP